MYGFDEKTSQEGNYIPAGIVENITLQDVLVEPLKSDGTGDTVLKFLFNDTDGGIFTHIEFPIDTARLTELSQGWGKSKDEADSYVKSEFEAQGERIKHILSCFIPKDKCVFKAKDFISFAEGVVSLLGENHKDVTVRIKTVYKKGKQFTTFPKRAFKPFIQPMRVPNKLVIDPKWDIVVMPTPDTEPEDTFATHTPQDTSGDRDIDTSEKPPW